MKTVVFDLQISSYDNLGQVKLSSDSNWIFISRIARELKRVGYHVKMLIDPTWSNHPEIKLNEFEYIEINYEKNPFFSRYFFDSSARFAIEKTDIIWTNEPCWVGQYRTFHSGPLIAYNHWIDNPFDVKNKNNIYFFRQIESYFKADYCLFNSLYGIDFFERGLLYVDKQISDKKARMGYVNPPIDAALIKDVINNTIKTTLPSIAFNHRLSTAIQYSGQIDVFNEVLRWLDIFVGQDKYQILVSNPSGKKHPLLDRKNVVNIHSENYQQYLKNLSSAWAQINLFTYPGQWSMSMQEALALEIPVYASDIHGYGELLNHFYFTDISDEKPIGIAEKIYEQFDDGTAKEEGNFDLAEDSFSVENIVKNQVIPILESL